MLVYNSNSSNTRPVSTLSEYLDRVRELRNFWQLEDHKELWFRGEEKKFDKPLRPNLYRPADGISLKPISSLLSIEYDLHDKFMQNGGQLTDEKPGKEDAQWDWYFLMQHHGGPNRLLDWSEGALIALHFAIRYCKSDEEEIGTDNRNPRVYVLEPKRMGEKLDALPDTKIAQENWKQYFNNNDDLKYDGTTEEHWEQAYLPDTESELEKLPIPGVPMLLTFDRISRRVAAQRSQFIIFGTNPDWLANELNASDSSIKEIEILRNATSRLRVELRDCGITESLVFPDLDGLGREMDILFKERISK